MVADMEILVVAVITHAIYPFGIILGHCL